MRVLISLFVTILVVSCTPIKTDEVSVQQVEQSRALHEIFEDYFQANLALNPLEATAIGVPGYDHVLGNPFTEEHRERARLLEEEFLMALETIEQNALSEQDRLSYQIFKYEREVAVEQLAFPSHLLPLNQMYNIANQYAQLGSGSSFQPFASVENYSDWLQRMHQIPDVFEQIQLNLATGLDEDIVMPRVLAERVAAQIEAHLVESIEDSLFYRPLLAFPDNFDETLKEQMTLEYEQVITDEVLPAYQELHEYLISEYLPLTRTDSYGLGALPQGTDWYAFEVERQTTTQLTPQEIHDIGLAEVARIHEEIKGVMAEVGFSGTLDEFFAFTRDDPQFHYESAEAMLEDYRAFAEEVESRIDRIFDPEVLPKADYEIRAVEPFRERSASSGSYSVASEDGSRPGIFYLNTYGLEARPTWAKGALTLHEAIPGHHYQLSIQRALTDVPRFRRFSIAVAYAEGWGLYTEQLGNELGVYGPYDQYGQLVAELWRAIRLVVDTGLHEFAWSRQQVLDYMYANAPVKEERAVSEAERFMALPGQALAYKIGQLKILELRSYAEAELGDHFDVRAFHYELLRHGSVPLTILEQIIVDWVEQQHANRG